MSALTDVFQNIANAIRTKTGGSDTYTPAQMPDAITNIAGANYDGAIGISVNGEFITAGKYGDFVVGQIVAFDTNNHPSVSGMGDVYFGNNLVADYAFVDGGDERVSYAYIMDTTVTPIMSAYGRNFAGKKIYFPTEMKSAEYVLGNASYWDRDGLPMFVFRGNTDLRGMFTGIPSWGGGRVNVYHPNIEAWVSTAQNNSLFGSTNKPYQGWSPFTWSKTNDDYYLCSDFNVALIRYTGN